MNSAGEAQPGRPSLARTASGSAGRPVVVRCSPARARKGMWNVGSEQGGRHRDECGEGACYCHSFF